MKCSAELTAAFTTMNTEYPCDAPSGRQRSRKFWCVRGRAGPQHVSATQPGLRLTVHPSDLGLALLTKQQLRLSGSSNEPGSVMGANYICGFFPSNAHCDFCGSDISEPEPTEPRTEPEFHPRSVTSQSPPPSIAPLSPLTSVKNSIH